MRRVLQSLRNLPLKRPPVQEPFFLTKVRSFTVSNQVSTPRRPRVMGSKLSKSSADDQKSESQNKGPRDDIDEQKQVIPDEHTFKRVPDHLRSCETESQLITICQMYNDPSSSWNTLPLSAFTVERLTKALTNKIYKVSIKEEYHNQLPDGAHKVVVLRILNLQGLTLDQLLSVYKSFADSGLGTQVLGEFDLGQIEQFIDGRDLNDKELLDNDQLMSQMAGILAKIHRLKPDKFCNDQSEMIPKLKANMKTAVDIFGKLMDSDSKNKEREKWMFLTQGNGDNEVELTGKLFGEVIHRELDSLIEGLESSDPFASALTFNHNDYHSGNMIMEKNGCVKAIDYDYAGYNYRAFDFGNFFCELMIDNYCEDPPYFKIDEEDYPTKEYRMRFVKEYMKEMGDETKDVDDTVIEERVMAIEYGCLLSHFWWAMWGIVESAEQHLEWDYMEYARQRLQNYFLKKKLIENHKNGGN